MLQKMGVTVSAPTTMLVHNIAAVFVTATLPPFAQPGMRIDATISSIGDAKSLEGGTLLLTSLYGPDGQVYGVAQGGMVLGGYSAGGRGNAKTVNHPTVGRIVGGVLVERDTAVNLRDVTTISLLAAKSGLFHRAGIAAVINKELGKDFAHARGQPARRNYGNREGRRFGAAFARAHRGTSGRISRLPPKSSSTNEPERL